MPQDPSPLPEEFLSAEFEYIANSAFQANEDRSKIASFFLVSVGSLVAAILGTQFLNGTPDKLLIAFRSLAGLFLVLSILGTLTVAQLARLRLAWHEAAQAMNQMKDYVADQYQSVNLKKAFRWRAKTLPEKFKLDSISFYNMLEVALLSALTFGACIYFSMLSFQCTFGLWPISLGAGGLAFGSQILFYKGLLKEKRKP